MTNKDPSKYPYDRSEDGTLTTEPTEGSHDIGNNIVNFPDRNAPDSDCYYEDNGVSWHKYSASYVDGDKEFMFSIWAQSLEDAERRLKLPMKINGQILTEI